MSLRDDCVFCFDSPESSVNGVEPERIVGEYEYWWVVLQPEKKRAKTKPAAGMLVAKRHIEVVSLVSPDEAIELLGIVKDAAKTLCEAVGMTYVGQEVFGYNEGPDSGQTQFHAHAHVLPIAEEYPDWQKGRVGMGKAFGALTRELAPPMDQQPQTSTVTIRQA